MSSKNWEEMILSDICNNIQYGYTQSAIHKKIGPKFLRITDIRNNFISWDNVPFCRINKQNYKRYKLEEGDIVIARTGATTGINKYIDKNVPDAVFASYLVRLKINKLNDPKFIYYILSSKNYKEYIKSYIGGSAQPNANAKTLTSFKVKIPNLLEQKSISAILSSLDLKIELNSQINKNLEQITQAIFKHWFVDFEFPDENGEPYKSSGGEMMDSELGLIPKEWKINRLHELTKRNKQKIKDIKDWENKKLIDLSIMPQFSFCITNFEKGNKLKTNIYKLSEFDILFGSIRPYFGKAGFSPINGIVAGTIFSYLPVRKDLYSYILCLTTSRFFIDFIIKYSRGTKMPIINWDDFVSYKGVVPENDKLLESFNNMIMPLLKEIKENINMNQDLSNIRDVLLPKLMSGEIRVPINSKLINQNN
jgi:type I restriction enzyme S subunit